jgi:MFS family permease
VRARRAARAGTVAPAMGGGLAVYLMGVFVGALDVNVLAPALPVIARSFHTTLAWTAWTVTAYTVAYAASTVLAGAVGDRVGRRGTYRVGLVLFGAASLLAALAPTFAVFVLARVVQGAGAGVVYPNAQAQGVQAFPPERRGLALGLFGAVFGLASIVGPNVGGALTQFFGWPSVFWFTAAFSAATLAATVRLPATAVSSRPMPDVWGGLAFAALLGGVLLALAAGGMARLGCALGAAAAALAFAWRQRTAPVAFVDPAPFARASGALLMAGAALIGLNMSAAVFVPALAQRELGLGVLASGVALMPAALSGAVLAGVGGVLVDRVGARRVLLIGLGAGVVGGLLLSLGRVTMPVFVLAMVAFGLATAFTMGAPINRIAMAMYADEQAGEALSLVAVFRSVGLAAGPVLLTLAARYHGFSGMFGAVALASALGAALFARVRLPATRARAVARA